MRFRHLDLNLLVALDVLLEERSVSRAANRLHLSQSATSGALARLRVYFDDEIMVMVGRTMAPTPLAQTLMEPVRDILVRVQSAIEARPVFNPTTARRQFRIAASDYVTEVALSHAIRRLRQDAPDIQFDISATSDNMAGRLSCGDVDLIISPDSYLIPEQPREILFKDTYSCVAWTGNDSVPGALTFENYLEMTHVTVMMGDKRSGTFEQGFLNRYGAIRKVAAVAPDFSSVASIIVGTDLITTMHTRLAQLYARYMPLRVLPVPIELPPLVEMMQWHPQFEHDPGIAWLRAYLRECASSQNATGEDCCPAANP
ncbi:LysR family transcriptional regulator [Nitrospirillum viridazoti]|uniref:Nodulation protein NfeD n=1 Tax=Nitrospirillum viridazoti CBAmc TaxID=1441467 RepID=A0A248JUT3_9PROT|nr:LysR family transcriptional regulator [Nitrospirillum amazonense]ASG22280.1 nodulation protein NfeD [Nitrospirillum amazonense CBAmc]TWB25993.1 DNA-binding transcriptional LysR family regulator [Nitrospirillum amazonense]